MNTNKCECVCKYCIEGRHEGCPKWHKQTLAPLKEKDEDCKVIVNKPESDCKASWEDRLEKIDMESWDNKDMNLVKALISKVRQEAYEEGKRDGYAEEAIGCFKHSAKSYQDGVRDAVKEIYQQLVGTDEGGHIWLILQGYAKSKGVEI
jgi:flagellar biosynthesis/type III secretory pathway protein FliH